MSSKLKLKNTAGFELSVTGNELLTRSKDVTYVDSVDALVSIVGSDGDVVHVSDKDRGGVFVYDSTAGVNDGGTIFNKFVRQGYTDINVKWFDVKGDGNNDAENIIKALSTLNSGDTLDFDGLECSVYNDVGDVPTNPSGEALPLDKVLRLYGVNNVALKNGKIYAYSPSVAPSKMIYPTTLSIDRCENITIENMVIESKGESYGDTDASFPLGYIDRLEFAQQNGGHALLVGRSKNVVLNNCEFRLSGSVAPCYSMSSTRVHFNDCFSNAGSLGYASYACDSWAGAASDTGFELHDNYFKNCSTNREGYTYGSKGCLVIEDRDVRAFVDGGVWRDAYANGSAKDIGYAFGASISKLYVTNAEVYDCQSFGWTGQSALGDGELYVSNCSGTVGKTVHQLQETSFGTQRFSYASCDFIVDGSRVWAGDGELSREKSSFIANLKQASYCYGKFSNCRLSGAEYAFINTEAVYGTLLITGCDIETTGYFCDSQGWGDTTPTVSGGVTVSNTRVEDSSAKTGGYIKFANKSTSNVYTYMSFIIDSTCVFATSTDRVLASIGRYGTNLIKALSIDSVLVGFYEIEGLYAPNGAGYVIYKGTNGTTGSNTRVVIEFLTRYASTPFQMFNSSGTKVDIIGTSVPPYISGSKLRVEYFIDTTQLGTAWTVDGRIICNFINIFRLD